MNGLDEEERDAGYRVHGLISIYILYGIEKNGLSSIQG